MNRPLTIVAALALACAVLAATPAQAEKRALILAISEYVRQPLPGVAKDVENASEMARLMGIPAANIEVWRDAELAGNGLLKALQDFTDRAQPEDHVFVYYSGHGSSYTKRNSPGACEKALVAQDITMVPKDEFHKRLKVLAAKVDKTFVFMDSCYSGGLVELDGSRALGAPGQGEARAKFTATAPKDPCSVASNVVASDRDFDMIQAEQYPNYFLLGSAAENEVAIDGGPTLGGYASSALLQCMQAPERADHSGDGVVSITEAKACAQEIVNGRLASNRQHNPNFGFNSMTLTSGNGQGGNTPLLTVTARTQPVNTPAFLQTLYDGRDGRRNVSIAASKNPVRIGEDFSFTVQSDTPGHLTLLVAGSSGKIYKLFPNEKDSDGAVKPGSPLSLPRPGQWRLTATPPTGANWFLVLVSDDPDRFNDLGMPAGIFRAFGDSPESTRGLLDFLFSLFGKKDTTDSPTPPANAGRAYGATLLRVLEVD